MIVVIVILVTVLIMSLFLSKHPNFFYRDRPAGLCEAALPDKPNWVSSLVHRSDAHYIAPLPVTAIDNLAHYIYEMDPKTYIVRYPDYLEGYRRTKFWGFTDWFCIKDNDHVTPSATIGHSDLGENRRWVEALRQRIR